MNLLITGIIIGLIGCTLAQFSGYNYNKPSGGGGFGGGFRGGFGGGGGGGSDGGGGNGEYTPVSPGFQTHEGASIDSTLLEQIRKILLKEELQSQSTGGFGGGSGGGGYPNRPSSSYGAPSSQYGVPSEQYGAPNYQTRVVDIAFESIKQANQVAQFNQVTQEPFSAGGGGGGLGGGIGGGAPSPPPPLFAPAPVAAFSASVANMPNREAIKGNIFDLVQRVTDGQ